jgi:hypothetical protein
MKHFLLVSIAAIFSFSIFSCQDDVQRDVKNYSFKDEAKIDTDSLGKYLIENGNKRVFEYRVDITSKSQNPINFSFGMRFEIDSSQTQFSIKDDQLKAALTHYFDYNGLIKEYSFSSINKGTIKGKQVAEGLWELEMDLEIQHLQLSRIKEKALFVKN